MVNRVRSVRKKRIKRKQRGGAVPLAAATCAPCMGAAASSSTGILSGLTALFGGVGLASQNYLSQSGGRRISQKRKRTRTKRKRKRTRHKRKVSKRKRTRSKRKRR